MIDKLTPITYTTFPSYSDTVNHKLVNEPLSYFEARFKKPRIGTKESTKVLAMTAFGKTKNERGSFRHKANTLDYYGIILDYDNDKQDYLSFASATKKLKDYYYIAYSTYRSTPSKNKYRIIIPFATPIPNAQLDVICDYFATVTGATDTLDNASKTISQTFIFPVCKDQTVSEYQYYINDKVDQLFDPSSLLKDYPIPTKKLLTKKATVKKRIRVEKLIKINVDLLNIDSKFKVLIRTGDTAQYEGDRSVRDCAVLAHLMNKGIDDHTILSIVLDQDYGISERFLEKGEYWTQGELERIHQLVKKEHEEALLTECEPEYPKKEFLSAHEASSLMRRGIHQWIKNPKGYRAIAAPAGIGKSHMVISSIVKEFSIFLTKPRLIEIYVPTHKLAQQMFDNLREFNRLKVVIIHGRSRLDKDGTTYCKKSALVKTLSGYGYGIYNNVCKECQYNVFHEVNKSNDCKYLNQFRDNTIVRIFTHAHLPLERGYLDRKYPSLAIIDESFCLTMIDNKEVTFDRINRHISNEKLASVIINSLSSNQPLLTNLRNAFGDRVATLLGEESKLVFSELPSLPRFTGDVDEINFVNQPPKGSIKIRKVIALLLSQLKAEIETFSNRKQSITVRLVNDKVVIANRNELTRFTKKEGGDIKTIPVLCIDADYSSDLAVLFLPGIIHRKLCVERNVNVVQVYTTTNAKTRWYPRANATTKEKKALKQHIDTVQQIINKVHAEHGSTLVIGYKLIRPLFTLPEGCAFEHFGAIRGLNDYENFKAAIVIGRNQLPIEALESQAAALWWDDPKELLLTGSMILKEQAYQTTQGKYGAKLWVCADDRVQLLNELHRERESLQALDRLRLIHNQETKHVFLICNVPLDITVNKLVTLKELKQWRPFIVQALAIAPFGVLPINPRYLTEHYNDLFPNINAAKKALQKEGLSKLEASSIETNKLITIDNKKWHLVYFGVEGRRGNYIKALAPEDMSFHLLKWNLSRLYKHKEITIIASTIKRRGIQYLKPVPSEFDMLIDEYYAHRQYDE